MIPERNEGWWWFSLMERKEKFFLFKRGMAG
jgi:hypothetical protein